MNKKDTKEKKRVLAKRKSVVCDCKKKQPQNDRAKYGTSSCDGYSFSYSVARILANAIYQFIADAKFRIVEPDEYWKTLENHADAIAEYADADHLDTFCEEKERQKRLDYYNKEAKWREAMHWLTENWQGLWW